MQDLDMRCVVAKFGPWLLFPEQKEHWAAVANDSIQTSPNEPDFLKKVIILKATEVLFSYVQCFLYFVSCSIKVSIFHSIQLDTFWTYSMSKY